MTKRILILALFSLNSWANEAPKDGPADFFWSSGTKDFFGTAYEAYDSGGAYSTFSPTAPISKVWFTGSQGVLSEIFWPTIDRRQTRDTQFLISDGSTFFSEERTQMESDTEWVEKGVPAFHVTNRDPAGRFSIEKTIFADPDRDAIVMKVKFHRFADHLKLYLLHKPAVANTGLGNSGRAVAKSLADGWRPGFYAWKEKDAQAVYIDHNLRKASVAYVGKWDGFNDLKTHLRMENTFEKAEDGNIVFTGEIDLDESKNEEEFVVTLGFAPEPQAAMKVAQDAAFAPDQALLTYRNQWFSYFVRLANLSTLSPTDPDLYFS